MKLTVLTENTAGGKFLAEHGLSYMIEHDGTRLLFDTGHGSVFLRNARRLGIDVRRDLDTVVLSHGHWDHGDGLSYLRDKTLVVHPGAFIRRYRKGTTEHIGLRLSRAEIARRFRLVTTVKPHPISRNVIFLGEIPRANDFEAHHTAFVDEQGRDDFVSDDSALAIVQNESLTVVVGCAHAGICNIVEHARKATGIGKVAAIIGGFHLKADDARTRRTVEYLHALGVARAYPSHCTELPALARFHAAFGSVQVKTGQILCL